MREHDRVLFRTASAKAVFGTALMGSVVFHPLVAFSQHECSERLVSMRDAIRLRQQELKTISYSLEIEYTTINGKRMVSGDTRVTRESADDFELCRETVKIIEAKPDPDVADDDFQINVAPGMYVQERVHDGRQEPNDTFYYVDPATEKKIPVNPETLELIDVD